MAPDDDFGSSQEGDAGADAGWASTVVVTAKPSIANQIAGLQMRQSPLIPAA